MRRRATRAVTVLMAVALTPTPVPLSAQATTAPPASTQPARTVPTDAAAIAAARAIIQTARHATLITLAGDGSAQARLVDPLPPDDRFVIRVATNPKTRKVAELRRDPRITLLYANPADGEYVTVHGTARLITDREGKARHWSAAWDPFYPTGPAGDDVVLVEVTARTLEVVSQARGIDSDPVTWRPVIIVLP